MSFVFRLSPRVPVSLLLSVLAVLITRIGAAQVSSAPAPALEPLETKLLDPETPLPGRNVITANSISPTRISDPSLWWAKDQFDEFNGKLITNWIAYKDKQRLDLVVNRQLWSILNYLEQYCFVNKFGTVAREYGYNVRIFNQQAALLATYTCDYSKALPNCELLIFQSFGQGGLQVPRQPLGGEQ